MRSFRRSAFALGLLAFSSNFGCAQKVLVRGQVAIDHVFEYGRPDGKLDNSNVVVWLEPKTAAEMPASLPKTHSATLTQKGKQFIPALLVVPVGSSIDFPNRDPFFHNVFSLYDGKRFDLGLYQAGETRSVRFDREGVSYIFCNIHPEMHAVVIAVRTPFFTVSDAFGNFLIADVPEGEYSLHVWYERGQSAALQSLEHTVRLSGQEILLPTMHVAELRIVAQHKNKFGKDYDSTQATPIY